MICGGAGAWLTPSRHDRQPYFGRRVTKTMLGRDNVKALGFVLTDDMQCSTAAGADLDLGLDDDFDARQMIRQITALDAVRV